jgi:hypothetical protein
MTLEQNSFQTVKKIHRTNFMGDARLLAEKQLPRKAVGIGVAGGER